jgi:hypothetical protein
MSRDEMLAPRPEDLPETEVDLRAACVRACIECAQACRVCAHACLDEPKDAGLTTFIRVNLDCADLCDSTGRLLSRGIGGHTSLVRAVVDTCAQACAACAEECTDHTTDQCQRCAEACRRCEEACRALLAVLD